MRSSVNAGKSPAMRKHSCVQGNSGCKVGVARFASGVLDRHVTLGPHICVNCEAAFRAANPVAPPRVRDALDSPGQALDVPTRASIEPLFGQDFSRVQVHTGPRASETAAALNARAYTIGEHVVFGAGRFAPHADDGRRLLAHELAHVVQNRRYGAGAVHFAKAISHSADASEREAAYASERVLRGNAVRIAAHPSARIQADSGDTAKGLLIGGGILGAIGLGVGIAAALGAFDKDKKTGTQELSLDDPAFRKRWEAGLQKGLARLKEVQPGGCRFPVGREENYDQKNWTIVQTEEDRRTNSHRFKPKSSDPFKAVDLLYKNLDRWTCDCRLFGEIALLFAWFETLRDDPAQFNKKFAGLLLSAESTTGLERTKITSEQLGSDVDENAWRNAPVGSKMVWKNDSPYARVPWSFEHAIKSSKGDGGTPDRYAAQGIGFDVSEDEVKLEVAKQCVPDFPYTWTVTDTTLTQFKAEGYSDADIKKLASIKGIPVKYLTEFVKQQTLVELNGGPIHIPYPDEGKSATTSFFLLLYRFAQRTDPAPADEAITKYIRENIRREKVEIPK
jgi:hypothetical protein